ncbi:hypothetical protein QQF64_002962 [Cirrhinus molitorella]|uniref:Ig-like domain-containing protein n=1 Tax=Cirrhinus molitorella TaxID=172907 RepID=A0ABR3MIN6_9TELE
MELVIFIVFQLLIEAQSYKSPTVKASPDAIRESSSVKISCETPADVKVNHCYFYVNRKENNIKDSSSCELELNGAEVLRWAAVKSPASIDINCFYTIHERGINKPSSHSPPASVTVLDALHKPIISVNEDYSSISCEIPLSVRANFICSLYTEDNDLLYQSVSQWSQSGENLCMFYVSPSDLFSRSVNSRQLICVYSLKTEPEIRSPQSDTYTIKGHPQANLRASASFILETDTVLLSCENTEDLKMEMCFFFIIGKESNSKQSSSCQLSLTGSQISIWSGGQSSSVRIICFYTVMKRQAQKPSAHSDPVTITVQNSTITTQQTTTTAMKTTLTTMSTAETTTYSKTFSTAVSSQMDVSTAASTQKTSQSKTVISTSQTPLYSRKEIWFIVLVSTGVAVILSGLMGLISLCWFASKKRRKQRSINPDVPSLGTGTSCSGPAEIYSLITSVPATSQPICGDVSVSKLQEQENPEDNENVYHVYCKIPDKPVPSNAEDHMYSLVMY